MELPLLFDRWWTILLRLEAGKKKALAATGFLLCVASLASRMWCKQQENGRNKATFFKEDISRSGGFSSLTGRFYSFRAEREKKRIFRNLDQFRVSED